MCVYVCYVCAGQFSEFCAPEIYHYHQILMPIIFQGMSDASTSVQGTSCYVLENFIEGLEPATLKVILPELMSRMGPLLMSPKKLIIEMALAALSSAAVSAENEFLPFVPVSVFFFYIYFN